MPVLTLKEFERRAKGSSKVSTKDKTFVEMEPVPAEDKFEYILFYPDNLERQYHKGECKTDISGEITSYPIVDGVVKVRSLLEKDFLVKEGYTFLRKQEVEE